MPDFPDEGRRRPEGRIPCIGVIHVTKERSLETRGDGYPNRLGDFFSHKPLFALYPPQPASWTPPTDIYESTVEGREVIVIKMEISGMNKDDIQILLEEDILTVKGKRCVCMSGEPEPKKNYHQMEINYGPFRRDFRISPKWDKNDINASYTDGFLRITIPRRDPGKNEISIDS